ncbi:MAG: S8 family serine peptidase [Deltaproteobacteria bacterium]|nr:S8 family serine peptidase [Deltaproteobacteria bacterium]
MPLSPLLPLLLATLPITPSSAPDPYPRADEQPVDVVAGELLVKLDATPPSQHEAASTVASLARRTGLPLAYVRPSLLGWHLVRVRGADAEQTRRAAFRLAAEPEVRAALPNARHAMQRAPDDPLLEALWGLTLIEAEAAWSLSVGSARQRLGVVDSGTTRAHRDLRGRVSRGFDFISDAHLAEDGDGRDDDDGDDSARGTQFHGTHVAGTMLARADDGFGVPGINWRGKLVSARVLGRRGKGSLLDIVEGAAWMAGLDVEDVPSIGDDRVSVINLSLGSPGRCTAYERDVYDAILARGVVLVAAAGNTGNDTPVGAPASCPGVIAVGAVGPDVALAPYSAFGDRIDVLAPGGGDTGDVADWILSADGGDIDGHRWLLGTSMAAPHVAGVVSLMQAVAPDLEPAMIRDILQESPWTCEGCDDEALLQADHAVTTAMERQAELSADVDAEPPRDLAVPVGDGGLAGESPADRGGGCQAAPGSAGLLVLASLLRRRLPLLDDLRHHA